MFDMVNRGLNGPDAARDAEAVGLINQWLQRPSFDDSVNLETVVPVCSGSACNPIPVALRPPDEYLWEENPFQLSAGGSGVIGSAGVDYLLPYWMARYYGVIPAVEVQSAAAPNGAVAPDSIAAIYGSNLASITQTAANQPPPPSLGGVTLTVTDSAGTARVAPLMYVSPSQINFVVPSGTAAGTAQFSIENAVANGSSSPITTWAMVQSVSPTLFSMSGDGRGVAAAQAVQTTASSKQTMVPVFQCTGTPCQPVPIALSTGYTTTLVLYGTGLRNAGSLSNVIANVNGVNVPVAYAGAQPGFEGLDQVNLTLPASLSGSGSGSGAGNVILTVDGQTANPVTVAIQ